jgi:hypothetical protein
MSIMIMTTVGMIMVMIMMIVEIIDKRFSIQSE